jgi:hypothetical protein
MHDDIAPANQIYDFNTPLIRNGVDRRTAHNLDFGRQNPDQRGNRVRLTVRKYQQFCHRDTFEPTFPKWPAARLQDRLILPADQVFRAADGAPLTDARRSTKDWHDFLRNFVADPDIIVSVKDQPLR